MPKKRKDRATPEARPQNAPNPIWQGIKKAAGLARWPLIGYAMYLAVRNAEHGGAPRSTDESRTAPNLYFPNQMWFHSKFRCYGYARNDLEGSTNPGSVGRKPKPYTHDLTCEKVFNEAQEDGLKKPIKQAADGCSVECDEGYHPVFFFVSDMKQTIRIVQADDTTSEYPPTIVKGWDYHWTRLDQNATVYPPEKLPQNKEEQANDNYKVFKALQKAGVPQEKDGTYKIIVKDNKTYQVDSEIFLGPEIFLEKENVKAAKSLLRHSHKSGSEEPTNIDEAGNEISCPPKAFFGSTKIEKRLVQFKGRDDQPAIITEQEEMNPCEFMCAPTIPDYPGYKNPSLPPQFPAAALQTMRSSNVGSYSPSKSGSSSRGTPPPIER